MSIISRKPPRLAQWILKLFYTDRGEFTHLGDFTQVFNRLMRHKGYFQAWVWYWGQTLNVLPWIISNKIHWSLVMFRNYLITAVRNFFKSKGFSFINITGLAVGMAACILIIMFVRDELSYDTYHEKADRIFRLAVDYKLQSRESRIATTGPGTAAALNDQFPEVEDAVRIRSRGTLNFQNIKKSFKETRVAHADPSFFRIFSIPLVSGEPENALTKPYSAVLARKTAEKYFGSVDCLGKTLRVKNRSDYKVTGIMNEIPPNTHFHFDILLSMASLEESKNPTWLTLNFQTYLLLSPDADPVALEEKLPELVKIHVGGELQKMTGIPSKDIFASGIVRFRFFLQPLGSIHLFSNLMAEIEPNSDIKYIYIFSAIALFILMIASINFVNLATARSSGRAREVGIRKVLGSQRTQLIRQFFCESVFFSFLAMLLALLIVSLVLPSFNYLAGKTLSLNALRSTFPILAIVLVTFLIGLLSSFYPALLLSAFNPTRVLKGDLRLGGRSGRLRSVLVVFQFTTSIVLIMGTITVYRQLQFIHSKNIGYDKELILVLDNASLLENNIQGFKDSVLGHPEFINATVTGYLPVSSIRNIRTFHPENQIGSSISVQTWSVDQSYIPVMGMEIVKGRNFSQEFGTDTSAVIINRTCASELGWEDPLGRQLTSIISETGESLTYTIIGMVEDFNFESLRKNITPLALLLGNNPDCISFRIKTEDIPRVLSSLKRTWREFLPNQPLEYFFMDDRFNSVYKAERRMGEISGVFSGLALIIGCLGLLGLASFTAEQRVKEIGIRKTLGASVSGITWLLLKDYLLLIVIANVIAWPIAIYVRGVWLRGFAYRAPFAIWIPLAAGSAAVAITLLTVGYQAVRTALSDPVRSLRTE